MRKELKKIEEIRCTFTGTFVRVGVKNSFGYTKQTRLLTEVKDAHGKIITDHLWFNFTKGLAVLGLAPGDIVRFNARVKRYTKGYRGYRGYRDDVYDSPVETDYKLSHPTRLEKVA